MARPPASRLSRWAARSCSQPSLVTDSTQRVPAMMRQIVEQSLRLRVILVAAAAVAMVVGVGKMRSMPVDVLPEFAPPYVEIQTEALGLSANEVEDIVTLNVEELVAGVPWLKTMR